MKSVEVVLKARNGKGERWLKTTAHVDLNTGDVFDVVQGWVELNAMQAPAGHALVEYDACDVSVSCNEQRGLFLDVDSLANLVANVSG